MSEQIEPGDLVRVVHSHCPTSWAEEQGSYFVVTAYVGDKYDLSLPARCHKCGASVGDMRDIVFGKWGRMFHPVAWLRKVPPLAADEVMETLKELQDA